MKPLSKGNLNLIKTSQLRKIMLHNTFRNTKNLLNEYLAKEINTFDLLKVSTYIDPIQQPNEMANIPSDSRNLISSVVGANKLSKYSSHSALGTVSPGR